MTEASKTKARMRYCWVCGDELGIIEDRHYNRDDTCGKRECEREARLAAIDERNEAHERLDRDMGY